jgi:hypothetical protein
MLVFQAAPAQRVWQVLRAEAAGAEAEAGAAEPPGPAVAEPVGRARVQARAASSPCESAEPMTAPARLPANPCQRQMEPRLAAPTQQAGPPAALEERPGSKSWKGAALVGRRRPQEQPARVAQAAAAVVAAVLQARVTLAPVTQAQAPPPPAMRAMLPGRAMGALPQVPRG